MLRLAAADEGWATSDKGREHGATLAVEVSNPPVSTPGSQRGQDPISDHESGDDGQDLPRRAEPTQSTSPSERPSGPSQPRRRCCEPESESEATATKHADPEDRKAVYRELNLAVVYDDDGRMQATAGPDACANECVGGT